MIFYQYYYGEITERDYPNTTHLADGKDCFLIYAKNLEDAKRIAKEHLEGKPFETLKNFRYKSGVVYHYIEDVAL